jgi:hypothetical protein
MRIAIYQGFSDIHFCIIGYLIEYLLTNNIEFDIFANEFIDWKEYYEMIFKFNKEWIHPSLLNIDEYDFIILVTDDDYSFSQYLIDNYSNKIIVLEHLRSPIPRRPNLVNRIYLRYNSKFPNDMYALPCYNAISNNYKKQIINNSSKINVVSIGYHNLLSIPNEQRLKLIFSNFEDINFHFINRRIPYTYNVNNIFCYQNISTIELFKILKTADYVFFCDGPKMKDYAANAMNSSIPKAYSYGCRLIIPDYWNKYYNFTSALIYDTTNNNTIYLNKPTNIEIDKVFDEREYLINHRNEVFNNIIYISK